MRTDAWHNMSVPPKTLVKIEISPPGEVVIFDPAAFAADIKNAQKLAGDLLPARLAAAVADWAARNPAALAACSAPAGYMISLGAKEATADERGGNGDERGKSAAPGEAERNGKTDGRVCGDLALAAVVFGRTVGGMYIPNRPLRWTAESFARTLVFLKNEVENNG